MTCGDLVCRITDPVHVGRIVAVVGSRAIVYWLGHGWREHSIPLAELQDAEIWKDGIRAPSAADQLRALLKWRYGDA